MITLPKEVRRPQPMDSPFLIRSIVTDRVLVIIPTRTDLSRFGSGCRKRKISAGLPPQRVSPEYIFYPFDIIFCLIVFCRAAGHIGSIYSRTITERCNAMKRQQERCPSPMATPSRVSKGESLLCNWNRVAKLWHRLCRNSVALPSSPKTAPRDHRGF